jgi:hypothetical protein
MSWKRLLGIPGFGWKNRIDIHGIRFEDMGVIKIVRIYCNGGLLF